MLHRSRHLAALALPTTLQPAPCLQHIIMALGAATDAQLASLATPLYERSRHLAEQDEFKVRLASMYSGFLNTDTVLENENSQATQSAWPMPSVGFSFLISRPRGSSSRAPLSVWGGASVTRRCSTCTGWIATASTRPICTRSASPPRTGSSWRSGGGRGGTFTHAIG